MTRDDLLAAVPVRHGGTSSTYVVLAEIPEPWRSQFTDALLGSAAPMIDNTGPCAWAWDWQQWVTGSWHRDSRAEGLSP
jgi:hypothetical protein